MELRATGPWGQIQTSRPYLPPPAPAPSPYTPESYVPSPYAPAPYAPAPYAPAPYAPAPYAPGPSPAPYAPAPVDAGDPRVGAVLAEVNRQRAAKGLQPLALDPDLCRVAAARSQDMVARRYFAHNDPDGHTPFWHLGQAGIPYRTAGENIAEGQRSPDEVMRTWMNSPGHRANILKPGFGKIGIGVAQGRGGLVWTQVFTG